MNGVGTGKRLLCSHTTKITPSSRNITQRQKWENNKKNLLRKVEHTKRYTKRHTLAAHIVFCAESRWCEQLNCSFNTFDNNKKNDRKNVQKINFQHYNFHLMHFIIAIFCLLFENQSEREPRVSRE